MTALAPVAVLIDAMWSKEEADLQHSHDQHKARTEAALKRVEGVLCDLGEGSK